MQASLVRTRNFEWIVGGNITRSRDKIKSLGGEEQIVLSYDNGVQMVNRVGESLTNSTVIRLTEYIPHKLKLTLQISVTVPDVVIMPEMYVL